MSPIRQDDGVWRADESPQYERLTSDTAGGPVGGRVFVRALPPIEEIQGHDYVKGREPLVDLDPDFAHDPQAGPSTTSDKIAEHWQAPKRCERCKCLAKPPGVTKGRTQDGLLCRSCSDPVMASFVTTSRGRPSRAHAELIAADAERALM